MRIWIIRHDGRNAIVDGEDGLRYVAPPGTLKYRDEGYDADDSRLVPTGEPASWGRKPHGSR